MGKTKSYSLIDYALFVTFFPQLIAGPIVHHREMMPQFMRREARTPLAANMAVGITIFSIGLFKKGRARRWHCSVCYARFRGS